MAFSNPQFFGEMDFHCVRKGVKWQHVTIDDLTIPDSYCNPKKGPLTYDVCKVLGPLSLTH